MEVPKRVYFLGYPILLIGSLMALPLFKWWRPYYLFSMILMNFKPKIGFPSLNHHWMQLY